MKTSDTHEDLTRQAEVKGSSNRVFGLVFAGFLLVVGAWPLLRGQPLRGWVVAASAVFLGLGLFWPHVLTPLNRAWMFVGLVLHRVTNPIVLGALFYGTIAPIGLLMRLLGKTPLRLSPDPGAASYWIDRRPPGPPPHTMRDQF